jgi:UDP-N-acetylmuramoyl-tripeptide--D-alanyl-D-alanine ligase
VTGSVGKTTTKDAIYHVLSGSSEIKVLTNKGNHNNEFGLPLTILEELPARSALSWIGLIIKCAIKVLRRESYYDVLVLEMGADSPGDLIYLTKIAQPNISVVTTVERVHLINFKSIDELAHEKSTLVHMTKKDGMVVLNYDNAYTRKMIKIAAKRNLFTYGLDKDADVKATSAKNTRTGLTFNVSYKMKRFRLKCLM